MRKPGLLVSIALAFLATILVLVIDGEDQPTAALATISQQPAAATEEVTHTVALPISWRNYDGSYVAPFGVIMYGSVTDGSGLQVMKEAGANWATTKLKWSDIEPSRGTYDWSSFDQKAQNAQAAGMSLFVLFTDNPAWAAEFPGGPVYNMQDLVGFVTAMAERYDCDGTNDAEEHPCVNYWSFYAEPDNGALWYAQTGKGYWGHNGSGYAAMLAQVSQAMHSVAPDSRVLMGGLAYDWFEEDGGPFVRSFLPNVLSALNGMGGATAIIDGITFHYYPVSVDKWASLREKANEINGIVRNQGAGGLPVLCPEMGYWSSPKFGSSEEGQARRLVQMFVRGLSEDMQILSWYKVFDAAVQDSPDDRYPDRTSGLLRVDRSFKPAYFAYKTMTGELAGLRYVRPLQAPGVEGYVFRLPDGRHKIVVWSKAGAARVAFPFTHLRLASMYGVENQIWDNQPGPPGDVDGGVVGQIELVVFENQPVYVEEQ